MIANGDVFVVGEKGLVGAKELADAGGVVDGGVEVGVVGDVDWLLEGCADDGVEGGFIFSRCSGLASSLKECGEFLAKTESRFSCPWDMSRLSVGAWQASTNVDGSRPEAAQA